MTCFVRPSLLGSAQESDRVAILCGLSKNHEFGLLYGHALSLQ